MRKIYMTQYILIGLSVFSASLSGMEGQLISTNDNTQATTIIKTLQTSCDLINNRSFSKETIDIAKKSLTKKISRINLETIPALITIIKNDDTLEHKTMLQESLNSELLKKQADYEKKRILKEITAPLEIFVTQHIKKQKDYEAAAKFEKEKIEKEKLEAKKIKIEELEAERIKSEKSEDKKIEIKSTYQKWFFAASLTVCLACLLLLLSKKSHFQRYVTSVCLH